MNASKIAWHRQVSCSFILSTEHLNIRDMRILGGDKTGDEKYLAKLSIGVNSRVDTCMFSRYV